MTVLAVDGRKIKTNFDTHRIKKVQLGLAKYALRASLITYIVKLIDWEYDVKF